MWFKRLRMKWLLRRMQRQIEKQRKARTPRWVCQQYFELLDPDLMAEYAPSQGESVTAECLYPSIAQYVQKLGEWSRMLRSSEMLRAEVTVVTTSHVATIDHLLSVHNGNYVDVRKVVTDFKGAGLTLCKLMEKSDNAEYGPLEHNSRLLKKTFVNLEAILQAVIVVTTLKPRV